MEIVIGSTTVVDNITLANGQLIESVAGGAGIYALAGAKLWHDRVRLLTGVGNDYENLFSGWFKANQLPMDSLMKRGEATPVNNVTYFENGERDETPRYGLDHYRQFEVRPADLAPYFEKETGIYIFKNDDPLFWQEILSLKHNSPSKVMWEIASDACLPEKLAQVKKIAQGVEILSINQTEAMTLLAVDHLDDIIESLRSWQIPLIFLRLGSKGAVMLTKDEQVFTESIKNIDVVDVTGGGNSSSGAVLAGYCANKGLKEIGLMGSISAAMCLGQFGLPATISDYREVANKTLNDYLLKEETDATK